MLVVERGRRSETADMIDVDVVGQPIQPGKEWPTLPAIATNRLPSLEEDVLGQVLGFGVAAGPKIEIAIHPFDESVIELAERVRITHRDHAIDKLHYDRLVGALS